MRVGGGHDQHAIVGFNRQNQVFHGERTRNLGSHQIEIEFERIDLLVDDIPLGSQRLINMIFF